MGHPNHGRPPGIPEEKRRRASGRDAPVGARGFPVDLALGTTEYLEVLTGARPVNFAADVWHRALNCGFRITGTGGEDSISSLHRTAIVGADRTYAYLGNKLDYAAWIAAFRQGRTFFTNGPPGAKNCR